MSRKDDFQIRVLRQEETAQALALARGVYQYCLQSTVIAPECRDAFWNYTDDENIRRMLETDQLTLWGCFDPYGQMTAMSAMQRDGLITMLYVIPPCQRRKIGKRLIDTMRVYARSEYFRQTVTVNAMPAWTANYFKNRKFRVLDQVQPNAAFIPLWIRSKDNTDYEKKKISQGCILGTVFGGLAVCIAVAVGFMICYLQGIV